MWSGCPKRFRELPVAAFRGDPSIQLATVHSRNLFIRHLLRVARLTMRSERDAGWCRAPVSEKAACEFRRAALKHRNACTCHFTRQGYEQNRRGQRQVLGRLLLLDTSAQDHQQVGAAAGSELDELRSSWPEDASGTGAPKTHSAP